MLKTEKTHFERWLKVWTAFLIAGSICLSCTAGDSKQTPNQTTESLLNNPLPQPDFVTSIGHPTDGCIVISQEPFWAPGYSTAELYDYLVAGLQFELDGNGISDSDVSLVVAPIAYPVYGEENELQGLFGGPITICINDALLKSGSHFAKIQLTDLSGEKYSFEWAFEIGADTQIVPTVPRLSDS